MLQVESTRKPVTIANWHDAREAHNQSQAGENLTSVKHVTAPRKRGKICN